MIKKIFLSFLVLLIAGLTWYLFIKKYDYQFETSAKYGPGAVSYELASWDKFNSQKNSGDIEVLEKKSFNSLSQRLKKDNEAAIDFKWELERLNDSTTAVTLNVLSKKDRLINRLRIVNPFKKSSYIDSLKRNIISFNKELISHQNLYRITPTSPVTNSPEMECICTRSENITLEGKAGEMMATITFLDNYVLNNKLSIKGYPFLKVLKWDREKDVIDFNFCFPVENIDGLKETANIQLKKYPAQKSLKLIFNGNYRLSHISWFDILYMAEERGLKPTGGPMEIFYDNPKIDIDELNWKAEIYLPVE